MRAIETLKLMATEAGRIPRRDVAEFRTRLDSLLEEASADALPHEHGELWFIAVRADIWPDLPRRRPISKPFPNLPPRVAAALVADLFADVEVEHGPEADHPNSVA